MSAAESKHRIISSHLDKHQALLDAIKARLPEFQQLRGDIEAAGEDGVYRFHHWSFKVCRLQELTRGAVEQITAIATANQLKLDATFTTICGQGQGITRELTHNQGWLRHTRPIVEAFFHARSFVEMMVRYGESLQEPPGWRPSGRAAVLTLCGIR